jgi:membrane protease YdiL (CAAX protease family)
MHSTALIRRHPVVSFYVLAFAISWGAIVAVVGPAGMTGTGSTIFLSGIVSLAGPGIAGVLMTWLTGGRSGLRDLRSRLLRWRVGIRWYAVALLTAPIVMAGTVFVLSVFDPAFLPEIVTTDDRLRLLAMGIGAGLVCPIFEEVGWTGFATPHLLERQGVLGTGLLIGVLWSIWHLPFFAGTTDPSGLVPAPVLVAILLFSWLPPYRVLMTSVYANTRSVLLAILMHAPIFAGMYVLADEATGLGLVIKLLAWGAAFWAIALVALWSTARAHERAHPTTAPTGHPA